LLESCCSTSFGPLGLDQLVVSSLNTLVVTKSGWAVLSGLSSSQRCGITRYLLRELEVFDKTHGDGTSGLCIMLSRALRHVSEHDTSPKYMILIARELGRIRRVLLPSITRLVGDELGVLGKNSLLEKMLVVAKSTLQGQFTPPVERELARLVVNWVDNTIKANQRGTSLKMLVHALQRGFNERAICFASPGVTGGTVLGVDQIIISRPSLSRIRPQGSSLNLVRMSTVRFIVMRCSINPVVHETSQKVVTSSSEEFTHAIRFTSERIEQILVYIRDVMKVNVLLSTEELPDGALDICLRLGMLAVQSIPRREATDICVLARTTSIDSISELYSSAQSQVIGRCAEAKEIQLGRRALGFHLVGIAPREVAVSASAVVCSQCIIRGPSDGLCKQYKDALGRVFRLLSLWTSDGVGVLVPVGGVAELRFSEHFRERLSKCTANVVHKLALETLCAGLLGVIDSLGSVGSAGAEPLVLKERQVYHLLRVLEQMLLVDDVLVVKCG